jgi:aerobic carbon-monoxide dehydrogenase large subunit
MLRTEDARLLAGGARYVANLVAPGALHFVVVRSVFAHARIRVDLSPALAVPGVVAGFSGTDLRPDWAGPLPMIWPVGDCNVPDHWPLALDIAKYAGDGVAVVVAESAAAAWDGAEVVVVDYDPLEPLIDLERALDGGAPLVHEEFGTNECFRLGFNVGDVDAVFLDADVVMSRTFRQQRVLPTPMEPRAVLAEPASRADGYVLWSSTQVPHIVRRTIGSCVGIAEHHLRVIAPDVGGAFGAKLNVYAEEALALALARRFGRPVRWIEGRSEHSQATTHGRAQTIRMEVAARRDGTVTGIKVSSTAGMGAYLQLESPGIPIIGRFLFSGAYRAEAYAYDCVGVFTNQTPTGAYRGAGRPEAAYAIERMMDVLAHELAMDPAEVRRRNFLPAGEDIWNPAGIPYDSVDYEGTLARALDTVGYEELRAEQRRRRAAGDPRRLGVGIAFYVDAVGIGPSAVLANTNYGSGGWEAAQVRMQATGSVEVLTGSTSQGQGHRTVWAQIVSDVLGVAPADVRVHQGDTDVVPMGIGTFGSRSLIVGGTAVQMAARKVLAKATRIAAHLMEAAVEDVVFEGGVFTVAGAPERGIGIKDVAQAAFLAQNLPANEEPGLQDSVVLDPADWTYPFGAHVAVVEVDTETGSVDIRSYVAVDDCGKVLNPMIVDGQVAGGIAQGIGQALFEGAAYTADGQLENVSLTNYLMPSAVEIPRLVLDRTVTPSPLNPLGAKGVGEAGTVAAPPAVMNAIHDAVEVDEIDMPAGPERVWLAVRAASGRGTGTASAKSGTV